MLNRINASCYYKVLLHQSAFPKKSLSILFYAKPFRVQQLGYEKLGISKLTCEELTLSRTPSLTLSPLSLSLSVSVSVSVSLSETAKVKKTTSRC